MEAELMTQVTHSLEHSTGVTKFMLIHISVRQQLTLYVLVTKVHLLMMQVFSTAHTFHYRWFVRLLKVPFNQKLVSRHVTESYPIHLDTPMVTEQLMPMVTTTTDLSELTI